MLRKFLFLMAFPAFCKREKMRKSDKRVYKVSDKRVYKVSDKRVYKVSDKRIQSFGQVQL